VEEPLFFPFAPSGRRKTAVYFSKVRNARRTQGETSKKQLFFGDFSAFFARFLLAPSAAFL
jgi:hypothetical protein